MATLCVTTENIGRALGINLASARAFKRVSAPIDLPFSFISPPPGGKNLRRGYHFEDVWRWIERAAPHRATPDAKRRLCNLAEVA